MPDQKPPQLAADERETLLALLRFQRESLVRKVAGLDETQVRQRMVDSGTTLLWLVKHLTRAETTWVLRRFAGRDTPLPDDTVTPDDTVATAVAAYRNVWTATDAIMSTADLTARCAAPETPVNLRWVLAHLLEETARHAGHADILRERIDGHTGR